MNHEIHETHEKADYSQHIETEEEFLRQDEWWNGDENMAVVQRIDLYIPLCESILDVGAGSGVGLVVWGRKASLCIAFDASARCCEAIRHRLPRAVVIQKDFRQFSTSAEVVIAKAFLKHFGPLEWQFVLRRLCDTAREQLIFTMGVTAGEEAVDMDLPAPYWQLCVPVTAIKNVLEEVGWSAVVVDTTWHPEWIFVCQRIS